MYKKEDYKVVSTHRDKKGRLLSAKLQIKGATFNLQRFFIKHDKPTSIFNFDRFIAFVDDDFNKGSVEIRWNTCDYGLSRIGEELGLDFVQGASLFSNGNQRPHYVEKEVLQ